MSIENNQINFIVTARKWRPLTFKDVVGQEHITQTMQNAIRTNRMHHAFLFSGPRGVGKTTTARILARALNCENPNDTEPCNQCTSCISILEGKSLDVIEIDGASNNSVDDIRKLRENAKYPPSSGRYKMYIIDEVHMLSTSAFNALLKTLEEPPPHLMFVFATTEQHKVPATILSRCQRHEFRRMEIDKIISHLKYISGKEQIEIDDESLLTIARKADGSMRDSQSIFDQVVAFSGKKVVYSEMVDALHLIDTEFFFRISQAGVDKNIEEMLLVARDISNKGYDLQECLGGLLEHYRNLLTVKVTNKLELIDAPDSFVEKYKKYSEYYTKADLMRILNIISTTEQSLRYSAQPKVKFELCLMNLASIDSSMEISELIEAIKTGRSEFQSATTVAKEKAFTYNASVPKLVTTPKTEIKAEPKKEVVKEETVQPVKHETQKETVPKESLPKDTSKEGLEAEWGDFVTQYGKADYNLQYLKDPYTSPAFMNKEVILHAINQLVYDNLSKNKKEILKYLNEYYGQKISIKILLGNEEVTNSNKESGNNANAKNNTTLEFNVLEQSIIDLFGAKYSPR